LSTISVIIVIALIVNSEMVTWVIIISIEGTQPS
jgi:hypothetical protein